MSREELSAIKKYLDEMLQSGFIRNSSYPFRAPVLIAKKPGGGFRICKDSRALNALAIKKSIPNPIY